MALPAYLGSMKPGDLLAERYILEKEIGSGHHGAVFQAVDTRLDARVAVKISDGTDASCLDTFQARFRREAYIGYKLGRESARFVSAFDWGQLDKTTLYLAMDLVPKARNLELREGERQTKLAELIEAARLVALAHGEGVIHRDLKPTNFLVDRRDRVFMADFGLAKVVDEDEEDVAEMVQLTQTNTALGTCVYMPPEQFENAKNADFQSDVYSLGVMLFLALTGRFPYEGKNGTAVFKKLMMVRHGRARPARPRDYDGATISPKLDAVCAQAIAVEAKDRTRSVDEFVTALEHAAGLAPKKRGIVGRVLEKAGSGRHPAPRKKRGKRTTGRRQVEEPPARPPEETQTLQGLSPWQRFLNDKTGD